MPAGAGRHMLRAVPMRDLAVGDKLPQGGEGVVVSLGPITDHGSMARSLAAVLRHTPAEVPIVVLAGVRTHPDARDWLAELDTDRELGWITFPAATSTCEQWNAVVDATGRSDVVLLHPDSVVGHAWLEGLRDAAASAGNLASATALSNHAAFASVPHRNLPWGLLPPELTADHAADRVRVASPRIRPRVPTALAHCTLVTRAALDLAGGFDERFAAGEDALADLSQRCLALGLQPVLADDVLVEHRGAAAAQRRDRPQLVGSEALRARYPDLDATILAASEDRFSSLARAVGCAARALVGISVTVDGRCLTPGMDGTRIHTLELIGALARSGAARMRVVLPVDAGPEARAALGRMDSVEVISEADVSPDTPRTDVIHRPWQVFEPTDLAFLDRLGERLVVTAQDLIGYRNRQAFGSLQAWTDYRRLTSEVMGAASAVVFFSREAAADALAEDLVPAERAHVVALGTDHHMLGETTPVAPAGAEALGDRPFLLCLGNRFRHKNVVFAMRVFERLRADHDWDGDLLLAGAETMYGSSSGDEAAYLGLHRDVAARVRELGAIPEGAKRWLLEHAAGVLFPSTYEGFGLVPFEAAAAGTACFYAPVSALAELLPQEAATLVPWDPAASAAAVGHVLADSRHAAEIVGRIREAGRGLTWSATAQAALGAYEAAVRSPAPPLAAGIDHVARVEHDYWALRADVGATGLALVVGDDALLDADSQRGLARIASRRPLRRALRAALRFTSRV